MNCKLHLVSGFLGSGKTTAIIGAARILMARGQSVGVITNDQGKYLVDTAFFRLADLPAVEVTGGCFCCNYADLNASLAQLIAEARPDVIFAESVGSCADLVATVVRPLLELKAVAPSSFSVLADARLLRRRLLDEPLPFSDDVTYIFDQQIEEAGLLVVNKADLLSAEMLAELKIAVERRWPGRPSLFQCSLEREKLLGNLAGPAQWVDLLQSGAVPLPPRPLEIDYQRYGAGETRLAWLDEVLILKGGESAARQAVQAIAAALQREGAPVGHLKFLAQAPGWEWKASFTSLNEPEGLTTLAAGRGATEHAGEVRLLVNARVEMDAVRLRRVVLAALHHGGVVFSESVVESFHPAAPVAKKN